MQRKMESLPTEREYRFGECCKEKMEDKIIEILWSFENDPLLIEYEKGE